MALLPRGIDDDLDVRACWSADVYGIQSLAVQHLPVVQVGASIPFDGDLFGPLWDHVAGGDDSCLGDILQQVRVSLPHAPASNHVNAKCHLTLLV